MERAQPKSVPTLHRKHVRIISEREKPLAMDVPVNLNEMKKKKKSIQITFLFDQSFGLKSLN